jgi:tetratricopeptide (TPR) repeat protein
MEQADAAQPADAFSGAASLLATDAVSAARRALEILATSPGDTRALMLLVSANRIAGDIPGARASLEALAQKHPDEAAIHYEIGMIAIAMKDHGRAVAAFSRVAALAPGYRDSWRLLGDCMTKTGQTGGAGPAYVRNHVASAKRVRTLEAAAASHHGQYLLDHLKVHPTDVNVSLLLAQLELDLNRFEDAERRLLDVLRRAPDFALARYTLAQVLHRQTRAQDAIAELDVLLRGEPDNPACLNLKALALSHLGDYRQSLACYERLLRVEPDLAAVWLGYGHVLKTTGALDKAVAAMKKAVELKPDLGEAYWQLADLKIFRFSDTDIAAMRRALTGELAAEARAQIHFALGKALEDARDHGPSFEEYAKGNAVRRALVRYSAGDTTALIRRSEALFTPAFFAARAGSGDPSQDPIFVVGLTRSGSTLIEQMLASHPAIEGTAELPAIPARVAQIRADHGDYPGAIERLDRTTLADLGAEYIARTRVHRKLGRARFVDKMPANFLHTGLIHLILPNAKIIDARRHPMSCGFANFKQHFTRGQPWSYDLADIGRYYRDYVELMAHFDAVLPGRVHRVIYEDVIADPEREARRLLDYLGLPFDEACLRFYENDRPVLTASAEQVRRPIFKDALEQWRHYAPWLGPLKAALGDVLDAYPAAPSFRDGAGA